MATRTYIELWPITRGGNSYRGRHQFDADDAVPPEIAPPALILDVTDRVDGPFLNRLYDSVADIFSDVPAPRPDSEKEKLLKDRLTERDFAALNALLRKDSAAWNDEDRSDLLKLLARGLLTR